MNKPYAYYEHKKLNNFEELLNLNMNNSNNIAFIFNNQKKEEIRKTYKDFYEDVRIMSNYLSNQYKNKHIAIISENSYNYLVLFFSIIISKNVAVLIDKDLSKEKIKELIKKSDCKVIYYSENYYEKDELDKKYQLISMEQIEETIQNNSDILYKNNKTKELCRVIYFTSGTTGANKGVMLSEENILSDIYSASSLFKPDGLVFSCLPFHHAFGLITSVLKPFYYGVPVFLNHSLKYLTNEIKQAKPNTMFVVPVFIETFYRQIWKTARQTKKDYILKTCIKMSNSLLKIGIDIRPILFKSILNSFGSNLKYIICGGAFLDTKYIKWFRAIGIEILNGYGITECSPVLAVNRNKYYKDGSVGQVVKDINVKIENEEILVKGHIVMLGYYKDEKSTKEVIKNGYFHTGDFGYLDKEGFLYITGRKKNLIILSNGENISPEVIEEKLSKDKGVCEVIVYAEDNKLVAMIYATEEYYKNISYFNGLIYKYNSKVPKNHQISKVRLRNKEFIKNNNRKILRNKIMEEIE